MVACDLSLIELGFMLLIQLSEQVGAWKGNEVETIRPVCHQWAATSAPKCFLYLHLDNCVGIALIVVDVESCHPTKKSRMDLYQLYTVPWQYLNSHLAYHKSSINSYNQCDSKYIL